MRVSSRAVSLRLTARKGNEMTDLDSVINFFEAELKSPCYLNPSTIALFNSTLQFLKELKAYKERCLP